MIYPARIIDKEGHTWWEGEISGVLPTLHVAASRFDYTGTIPDIEIVDMVANYEWCLPPEDGGPLYIYRLQKET